MEGLFEKVKMSVKIRDAYKLYDGRKLEPRGKLLVGHCSKHKDGTPSFNIYEETNSFYCFGCGFGGDVINYVAVLFNKGKLDSAKKLAIDFGIQINADKKIDIKKVQSYLQKQKRLDEQIEIIKFRLKELYNIMCKKYRLFKSSIISADKISMNKVSYPYQFLLFNMEFYDRYTQIFINGDIEKKIDLLLHLDYYYTKELEEFKRWHQLLVS